MALFHDIEDPITDLPEASRSEICGLIRELTALLNMDSYDDMGERKIDMGKLAEVESTLRERLGHVLAPKKLPDVMDREVLKEFATAYLLEALYPDTVGPYSETWSTIELKTLPLFQVRSFDPGKRDAVFDRMSEAWGLDAADREAIRSEVSRCAERVELRRRVVDHLRTLVGPIAEDRKPSGERAKALFDRYFPGNPFLEEEVELVITRTCVYWCVPASKQLKTSAAFTSRSEEEQKAVLGYLKTMRRFSFQYFSHFPTFSSFDARDADPALADELAEALGLARTDAVELLNGTATIETTPDIEKYLIHDTYGHIWQADLTGFKSLYDTMESLRSPVDANEHLQLEGNAVSMLDLLYLNMRGEIVFNREQATRYIDQWVRMRIEALLAPVVAELTADVIEYKYRLDNAAEEDLLPSSSLFADNPAKLDFAWVDLSYFVKTLKKVNRYYLKNEELKENLIQRIRILLKLKYPRQFKNIASTEALDSQITAAVDEFLGLANQRQNEHLNQEIPKADADGAAPEINAFFQMFANLLRIQFSVNAIIEDHLEDDARGLTDYFNVLTIFIARHFVADPLKNFWSLDEVLAAYALPVLKQLRDFEKTG